MRTAILALLAVALLGIAIATWGSIGSILMIFCLLIMGAALLYQRFLTNREENDFDLDQ